MRPEVSSFDGEFTRETQREPLQGRLFHDYANTSRLDERDKDAKNNDAEN